MGVNNSAVSAATSHNILLGILTKGTSKTATAAKAGMAYSTFNRKLGNAGDFTLRELGQIADALDLRLADLIPADPGGQGQRAA